MLRVPLIFSLPGRLPAGQRVGAVVENIDVLPTLLSIVGIRPAQNGSGRDLSSLFLATPQSGDEPVPAGRLARSVREPYTSMPGGQAVALRNHRWKTIIYSEASNELYDLESDPGETTNLASQHPERVALFQGGLDAWLNGKRFAPRSHADLDPDDYQLLKDLGYIPE